MNSWIATTVARTRSCIYRRLAWLMIGIIAATGGSAFAQHAYPTPEAAADAMVDAIKREDAAALNVVLGTNWKKFIPTQDREDIDAFLAEWDKSHRIEMVAPGDARIDVGDGNWTLPIPIVNAAGGWRFDARAGADEMKTRRIGRNELASMQAALAYFDAQKDYARVDRTGEGVLQYAQHFWSSPGKHDGLYWPANDNDQVNDNNQVKGNKEDSPLGPLFADTNKKKGEGYHGYNFKILTAQGKDAPGGAYSYLIKNRMVSGFALIAWPIQYGESGVMSLMISHDGQLYEKDLGEKTDAIARQMTAFNPDGSWRKVNLTSPSK